MHIVHAASTMSTEERSPAGWVSSACKWDIQVCSNLNAIGPNKLMGIDTVRRQSLVEGSVSYGGGP